MKIGMMVVWFSLIFYLLVVFKAKIIDKKERKWVFLWVGLALGISMLDMFHISLSMITTFLNVTFEGISRMVVKL